MQQLGSARLDKHVAALVRALNQLAGVVTTGSCQGHLDDRRPYVSLLCDEASLRLVLRAMNVLNAPEPKQVRAYVEILDYGRAQLDVVLRFHHLSVPVKPKRGTVIEWHRRIRQMTELIVEELEGGILSRMDPERVFQDAVREERAYRRGRRLVVARQRFACLGRTPSRSC